MTDSPTPHQNKGTPMTAKLVRIERGIAEFDDGTTLALPPWVRVAILNSKSRRYRLSWRHYGCNAYSTQGNPCFDYVDDRRSIESFIEWLEHGRYETFVLYAGMGASL